MLSRMADHLFWLSRYTERAENLARILDVTQRLASMPAAYGGELNVWQSAIATAACKQAFEERYREATRANVIQFMVGIDDNPHSIKACIETARANARAVRTAITTEMWEILNGAWNDMQRTKPSDMLTTEEMTHFLTRVMEMSLRFDGAAYRTMLRTDAYWFQRLGTFLERADNMARLLDVKYHVLLPDTERVGGGLDYFQWASILRSVNALTSFHWVYRRSVEPWLVADFLILRPEQPRSLISCYTSLHEYLDRLADAYGRQGPAQRQARATVSRLANTDIETLFQSGLHEFLTGFLAENNKLGEAISQQYLI
jgi:uncharacterized alpha-E superfamily protein